MFYLFYIVCFLYICFLYQTDIGGGVFVPDTSLRYVDHTKYQRLTTGLLALLFNKEELRQSSLTGKTCNIHKDTGPKNMLDQRKVEALVGEMINIFSCFMSLTENMPQCGTFSACRLAIFTTTEIYNVTHLE